MRRQLCAPLVAAAALACSAPSQTLTREKYAEDWDAFSRFVRDRYCYFDEKATDWAAVDAELRPLAAAAPDTRGFIRVLEAALDELYDPHTHLGVHLADSWRLPPHDIWAEWRGERALVLELRAGSAAERAAIRAGDEVTQVDGQPVAAAAAARMPRHLHRPDPAAHGWALLSVLAGRRDRPRVLTLRRTGEGEPRSVTLEEPAQAGESPAVASRRLESGLGYIRIASFAADAAVEAFDRALDSLRDTRGLVLDVRDNPGGDTAVARPIMGRLIGERKPYALMARRQGAALGPRWTEYVDPRGPWTYAQPVVVIVNHWTASMPEGFAMGLDGMRRALVVGTPMSGLGAAIASRELPHTRVRVQVSSEPVYHVDGTPRQRFLPRRQVDLAAQPDTEPDPLLAEAVAALGP